MDKRQLAPCKQQKYMASVAVRVPVESVVHCPESTIVPLEQVVVRDMDSLLVIPQCSWVAYSGTLGIFARALTQAQAIQTAGWQASLCLHYFH